MSYLVLRLFLGASLHRGSSLRTTLILDVCLYNVLCFVGIEVIMRKNDIPKRINEAIAAERIWWMNACVPSTVTCISNPHWLGTHNIKHWYVPATRNHLHEDKQRTCRLVYVYVCLYIHDMRHIYSYITLYSCISILLVVSCIFITHCLNYILCEQKVLYKAKQLTIVHYLHRMHVNG